MRLFIIFLATVVSFSLGAQNIKKEFGFGYFYISPIGTMDKYIDRGHGFTMDYYIAPTNSRFAGGVEFSYTIYGHDKDRQQYSFDDGTQADMDIVVDNSITNLSLAGRYYLRDENIFRPYLNLKAGYSWFRTELNIYDPSDDDHCAPVDHEILLKDGTLTAAVGAGFHWDLAGIFKKLSPNRLVLNFSSNLVLGGMVSYMNTDGPESHQTTHSDVSARFINTQTQVIHEHHVGYVYSSYVEMIEFRTGIVFKSR